KELEGRAAALGPAAPATREELDREYWGRMSRALEKVRTEIARLRGLLIVREESAPPVPFLTRPMEELD
ncbi:MAG: hypothetical protein ACYTAF_15765, partial [Planctomycetota bacterium]